MSNKALIAGSYIGVFSTLGFALHLAWEYFQCSPFFRHIQTPPTANAMLMASFGDVVMMGIVYLGLTARTGRVDWFNSTWNLKLISWMTCLSLFLAVLIEVLALNTDRWAYTAENPVIPWIGISLLPVFQMVIINPAVFCISKKIVLAIRGRRNR